MMTVLAKWLVENRGVVRPSKWWFIFCWTMVMSPFALVAFIALNQTANLIFMALLRKFNFNLDEVDVRDLARTLVHCTSPLNWALHLLVLAGGIGSAIEGRRLNSTSVTVFGIISAVGSLM
ncbi:hypothetical protein BT96DRAFT_510112 [Gymnopus androsaceus JB14]|uniref:Uncharacterized protein n=1 Tax=Gymnopus androsaceus JB14 TaxID=1447944 RepID=A0A6A4I198_9AGAR|nr:hypothetical protein BT96DRAFT_510112 [Gymnopus androsaceus JB14]